MRPLSIAAITAISAIGRGRAEMLSSLRAFRTGLQPNRFAGLAQGWTGRIAGVEQHALPAEIAPFDCRNNRLADMALRTDGFADRVRDERARLGEDRIAVIVGTSTSGVEALEQAYAQREPDGALPAGFDYDRTHDLSSLAHCVRAALGLAGPAMTVSTACASSARCFADAVDLIEMGVCDAAVVGGADSLCRMTLRGFASLSLVAPGACRPCDPERDGISIGEAAGFALLTRTEPGAGDLALLGTGCSSDAHHMSAPHPEARGAILAMRAALDDSGLGPDGIDYVNLHGTATKANDQAEDLAVAAVFGDRVPCSSTKGWTGHTMGSSGILEATIAALCIEHGLIPGCLGAARVDPAFRARVPLANEAAPVRRVLSNSFGFGGINCSLVLGRPA